MSTFDAVEHAVALAKRVCTELRCEADYPEFLSPAVVAATIIAAATLKAGDYLEKSIELIGGDR